MHGGNIVEETSLNAVINPGGEIEGDFETYDSTDIQAQVYAVPFFCFPFI